MATKRGRRNYTGIWDDVWTYKGTVDVASLVDGAGASQTFTLPGVTPGDHVISHGLAVSEAGITVSGYVSAADTVTLRYQNESGGTVDLASAVITILVGRPSNQEFIA